MTAITKECALCHQPVDPLASTTLRKVSGYVGKRGAVGGTNAVRLKQEHDEFIHAMCAERVKQGHSFGQTQLGGVA